MLKCFNVPKVKRVQYLFAPFVWVHAVKQESYDQGNSSFMKKAMSKLKSLQSQLGAEPTDSKDFGKKKSYLLANTIVQAQLGSFKAFIFHYLGKFSFVAEETLRGNKLAKLEVNAVAKKLCKI